MWQKILEAILKKWLPFLFLGPHRPGFQAGGGRIPNARVGTAAAHNKL